MASVTPTYLQDELGRAWQLSIRDTGAYGVDPVVGVGPVQTSVFLQDQSSGKVFNLVVLLNAAFQAALEIVPAPPLPQGSTILQYVPCLTPNGTSMGIAVNLNRIVTILVPQPGPPAPQPIQGCQLILTDAYAALGQRLYDETNQFWPQAELLIYLQEAIRSWNALTGYYRGDFVFPSAQGTQWYDLTTVANTLRPMTLRVNDLYTEIEYHLLEPPTGSGAWTGSSQFSFGDIEVAVSRRRSELLGLTGCQITRRAIQALPGRTAIQPTTLDLRRVAFVPQSGLGDPRILWQDDAWGQLAFEPDYATMPPGIPETYRESTEPLFTFDVDRQLNVPGVYDLLTVESVADPLLSVPDDWAWVLKWGALADLLGRESNAKDIPRQRYCERRYREGASLLTLAPALLAFRVNGVPIEVDTVRAADEFTPDWYSAAEGAPSAALVAGLNLVALNCPPFTPAPALGATVVRNALVPSAPTDCLNLSTDVYEAILDEAQHLAAFKMGGAEFEDTMILHQRFMDLAAVYASRIAEMGEFARTLYALSRAEASANPRLTTDTAEEVMSDGI